MSTKKAKSASHTGSDSSSIGCPFSLKNCPISSLRAKNRCSADPRLSHLTSLWYITSPYSAWMSSKNCWNCRWYSALERIELIAFTTGFITWSNLRCLAQRACWWIIQWSLMALPPSSLTLLQISVDNPLRSPAMAGAPSVMIPGTLLHSSFISSTASQTETNKSDPLVWPFMLWRSSSSSVMFMLLSTPLKKISSCAVSDTSVLSSQANEK